MEKRKINDQMMRTVEIPIQPKRIVSLVPSQTELLYYFGLEDEVLGITKFCIHPQKWFKNKSRIGGTKELNISKILDLKPDLVIGNKEENTREDIEELERNGVKVWMSDINSFDEALTMIKQLGTIVNKNKEANQLCEAITHGFQSLRNVGKGKSVLYLIWDEPPIVVGKNTFIHSVIEQLGFLNACSLNRYPQLNQFPNPLPDYIFLSSEPFPFSQTHIEKYQRLFPKSKVILVDGEMFSWYGSHMLEAVQYFNSDTFAS